MENLDKLDLKEPPIIKDYCLGITVKMKKYMDKKNIQYW